MRESITGSIARYDLAALSPVATQVATAPIHALDAAAGLIAQGEDNGRVTIRDGATLEQIGEKLTLGPYRSRDRGPEMAPAPAGHRPRPDPGRVGGHRRRPGGPPEDVVPARA